MLIEHLCNKIISIGSFLIIALFFAGYNASAEVVPQCSSEYDAGWITIQAEGDSIKVYGRIPIPDRGFFLLSWADREGNTITIRLQMGRRREIEKMFQKTSNGFFYHFPGLSPGAYTVRVLEGAGERILKIRCITLPAK